MRAPSHPLPFALRVRPRGAFNLLASTPIACLLLASPLLAGEGVIVHEVALPTLSGGLGQFTMQGTSPPPQTDVFPIAASVPRFPACSEIVLTSVRVRLTTSTAAQFQASSQPGSATSVSGSLSVSTTLAGAGFTSQAGAPIQQAGPIALSVANGFQAYPALAPAISSATIDRLVPASALGAYLGTGTATFSGQTSFMQTGSASPYPVLIQFFRSTSRVLTVTYVFTTPPADVNGDQTVDALDLSALLAAWGSKAPGAADVDGDGAVDANDLAALLAAWGPVGCSSGNGR